MNQFDFFYIFLVLLLAFLTLKDFLQNGDEVIVLLFLFLLFGCYYRYLLIETGIVSWVNVKYSINFTATPELISRSIFIFFLGSFLWIAYAILLKKRKPLPAKEEDTIKTAYLELYIQKHFAIITIICLLVGITGRTTEGSLQNVENLSMGNGYTFLYPMLTSGTVPILYLCYKAAFSKEKKVLALCVLSLNAYLTFSGALRFRILAWIIVLAIMLFDDARNNKKIIGFFVLCSIALIAFSVAGISRYYDISTLPFSEMLQLAFVRISTMDDLNMLDGLIMSLQIYPDNIPYAYGLNHFDIFLRPIPRSIWAGKPVGGYVNKLNIGGSSAQTGISESIFGTFYSEGGIAGVVILSILYAYVIHFIYRKIYSIKVPVLRKMMKGVLVASIIPLLRGGDLAGIFAFIGMTFLPLFLFLYLFNRSYKKAVFVEVNYD